MDCYNSHAVAVPLTQKEAVSDSDAKLVEGCLQGDPLSWELLIRRYQNLIYSVPIRYRFSPEDASDVFQSVCVILLQNLRTLRSVETLSTWLYVTTRRECWKLAKKKSREVQLEEWAEAFAEPEGEKLILQYRIRQALDLVSEKCQQLLEALYYADPPMSYDEVSKHFAIPFGSIGPTRARCLEKLRKLLGKKG